MRVQYSMGICINGSRINGGTIEALSAKKATEFVFATKSWLDTLKKLPTFAKLLDDIDKSKKRVDIYRTWEITGGNYQGGDDPDLAMVVPFDEVHGDGATELSRVLNRACEDVSGRSGLKKALNIGKAKPRFLARDAVARLVGVTPADFAAMEKGTKAIPASVDAKLKSYLYDFLTPGPGCPCHVAFNHLRDNLSPDHKKYLPNSQNWMNRPPGIALGHELIHAWRVVVGKVLFDYGWEEEAMTVGLPPFSNMPFTENRLRIEYGGLAIRPDYQNITTKTPLVADAKLGVDKSNMAWQGNQGALHTQQKVAQAMSSRRKAMGYDDEEEASDGF